MIIIFWNSAPFFLWLHCQKISLSIRKTYHNFETLCNDEKIRIFRAQKKKNKIAAHIGCIEQTSGRFSAWDARSHKIPDNVFAWGCFSQSVSSLDDSIDEGYRIKDEPWKPGSANVFFFFHRHRECCISLTLSSVYLSRGVVRKFLQKYHIRYVLGECIIS